MQNSAKCRFCGNSLKNIVVDLGMSPLCESYVSAEGLNRMEAFYPLHVYVCDDCFLVQLEEYVTPEEIYSEYAYFSSYSDDWLKHAKNYVSKMTDELGINENNRVVEIASNDGYLLQYFVENGIPVLGIEPAQNIARVAEKKGVPTVVEFFGKTVAERLVKEEKRADLLLGNNVLAHVPDINDFVSGMKSLLKTGGVITMEFPHLMCLIEQNQFDTIYHEHFSYISLYAAEKVFARHGITLYDVEELPTHGGSLRIFGRHAEDTAKPVSDRYRALMKREIDAGVNRLEYYRLFGHQVVETKYKLLEFLISAKRDGKSIAGYGAPGKGNTLLNYCGIRTDFINFTVDRNPYKQGKFLPGTHIPIFAPEKIDEVQPDYLLILPWNFKDEIIEQMTHIRDWGGKFVVPIPEVEVL
jgi:2-polyprenyl-3-methyl-5-hydroxy-6-metoxy-1,4-benzoquinol methylase